MTIILTSLLNVIGDNWVSAKEREPLQLMAFNNNNSVNITIKDTGIGIPSQEISKIFDRFYRIDKARAKETGGSGLGLAIVKWIMDVHKGKITIESNIGEGTSITVELPTISTQLTSD